MLVTIFFSSVNTDDDWEVVVKGVNPGTRLFVFVSWLCHLLAALGASPPSASVCKIILEGDYEN